MESFLAQLWVSEITDLEFAIIKQLVAQPSLMIGGDSTGTALARRSRNLARRGLLRYRNSIEGGWPSGMWAAYPTCNGRNAIWRHAGDTHIDGCGAPWNPDGTCSGCARKRALDLAAYEAYLSTLSATDRNWELSTCPLWCTEHGYMRRIDVQTTKVCRFNGSPLHAGGLFRLVERFDHLPTSM